MSQEISQEISRDSPARAWQGREGLIPSGLCPALGDLASGEGLQGGSQWGSLGGIFEGVLQGISAGNLCRECLQGMSPGNVSRECLQAARTVWSSALGQGRPSGLRDPTGSGPARLLRSGSKQRIREQSPRADQATLLDQVKRVKEIEAIESDAFVPQTFRSSKEVKKVHFPSKRYIFLPKGAFSFQKGHFQSLSCCMILSEPGGSCTIKIFHR
uniref:Uncharacterized protein n=1 Tax=Zonotrichia albicollis TaxID=44394 RepID=A0A8D2MEQ7_ZONAL